MSNQKLCRLVFEKVVGAMVSCETSPYRWQVSPEVCWFREWDATLASSAPNFDTDSTEAMALVDLMEQRGYWWAAHGPQPADSGPAAMNEACWAFFRGGICLSDKCYHPDRNTAICLATLRTYKVSADEITAAMEGR